MKHPNAQDQVAALLDLLPPDEPARTIPVTIEVAGEVVTAEFVDPPHADVVREFTEHESRVHPRNLPQRTITAHTVALVSTLLALGDATIGPRAIPIPEGDIIPRPIPPRRRDVFGLPRSHVQVSHTRSHILTVEEARVVLASKPGDLARIEKAEAKRARKAARNKAQERKA